MAISIAEPSIATSPRPLFYGFPYFVTRLAPANYHFILLPAQDSESTLHEFARCQAALNDLPSCLVLGETHCFYGGNREAEAVSSNPPRGGIVYRDRLRPIAPIQRTIELTRRYRLFDRFAEGSNPANRIVFGELTKGGRPATPAELRRLSGLKRNRVPRGLQRCRRCGDWRGRCLDPSPLFKGMLMPVSCRCENRNLCAACLKPLHDCKLNANYFDPADGMIWHVAGMSALAHRCEGGSETVETRMA